MISSEVWNCCLGIIKLSIGIDTSAAIFGIMRFNETKELRFKIVGWSQTKSAFARRRIFVCIIQYSLFIGEKRVYFIFSL